MFVVYWIAITVLGVAWLNFEMLVADLGPLYDEDYKRIE